MGDYQMIKSRSTENDDLIQRSFSDKSSNDCDDEFASFKCYSPREIENLVVSFNQIKSFYSLEEDIVSFFYSLSSSYQMQDDDIVGICPLQKPTLFISKSLKECQNMTFAHEIEGDQLISDEIVAKKVTFNLKELPANVVKEYHFQFCYKNKNGEVIGLSIPFRLLKAGLNESTYMNMPSTSNQSGLKDITDESILGENQDDDDFIVVRSQESFLKERNEHLTNTTKLLEYLVRKLEKDVKDKMNEIEILSDQLQSTKVDLERALLEKQDALKNCDLLKSNNIFLNESIMELKHQIELEQKLRTELQNALEVANRKVANFENISKELSLGETEMKKILNDKEDEISSLKDMVNNLSNCNDDLNAQIVSHEKSIDSLKSSLAGVMNERRVLLEKIEKLAPLSEIHKEENANLMNKIKDLELIKENQTSEIASLEAELQNSISNLKNLNLKYQKDRASKEQQKALDMEKLKYEALEMRARLESSRIEYGNLYRKYQASQKKIGQIKTEKSDNIYPTLQNENEHSSSSTNSANKSNGGQFAKVAQEPIDSIDVALLQLEKEEERKELLKNQPKVPQFASSRVQPNSPLIDINNYEQATSNSTGNTSIKLVDDIPVVTSVKRLISETESVASTGTDRTVVSIPCIMCNNVIQCRQHYDGSGQMHEMVDHLEQVHKQRMCPFCSTLFDTRLPIFSSHFNNHVQDHLEESRYPGNSAN